MKIQKIQVIRRISQILAFFFFAGIFSLAFSGFEQIYTMLVTRDFNITKFQMVLIPLLVVIGLSVLTGRFFCGWLCAFGALNDFLYNLTKKLFPKKQIRIPKTLDKNLKYLKYVILGVIVVFGWTLKVLPADQFNPWAAFAQFGSLLKGGWSPAFLVLFLIIGGAMLIERFFCRYLCPLGAILALISKLPLTAISKSRTNCNSCRVCSSSCPMGMNLTATDIITGGECIRCLRCIEACPKTNTALNIFSRSFNTVSYLIAALIIFIGINLSDKFLFHEPAETGTNQNAVVNSVKKVVQITAQPQQSYRDGVYVGEADGFRPGLKVKVTVKNGKIADIQIIACNDDPPFSQQPSQVIPEQIIATQSTEVDAVSGATYSSMGIINAVKNALSQATQTAPVSQNNAPSNKSASSIKSEIVGRTDTDEIETDESEETAATAIPVKKIQNQEYRDGTYQGEAVGFRPGLRVSIILKNDKIMDVQIVASNDDRKFAKYPFQVIPAEIVAKQSADVDAVSGATYTSRGIMDAVKDALQKATISASQGA